MNSLRDKLSMSTIFCGLRQAALSIVTAFVCLPMLSAVGASASPTAALNYSPAGGAVIAVDWQDPWSLPPGFRNHCSYDVNHGRWYCSNHCGIDYQFYFCSPVSFGCCRPGYGYCDWKGHLRCAP
jgi:hypothetical protein